MERWAPYPTDRPSRQRGTEATSAQSLTLPQSQPGDSSVSQPTVSDNKNVMVEDYQATSSNRVYHTVNASGNASLHLGDVHYHSSQPGVSVKEQLLSSLHFREMFMRYDNIDDPHSETFKWIFEPPGDEQPEWDSFLDWLNGDGGLYWISGKPGSGKSVLMKYLASNFQQSLRSANDSVVCLSFWFWEAAHTDLERGMLGCLRSLLWQVLRSSEYCDSIVRAVKVNLHFEWTKRRLRDAFNTALKVLSHTGVKMLIFLDGLDESDSDTTEVMDFAIGIAKSFPMVKVCVSSRPEPILQLSLQQYPHLRMQALNRPDVLAIVQQDLFDVPQFVSLIHEEGEIELLRNQLASEAQGVLLWIRIVTKDLLRGVADGDTYPELRARLDQLPAGLDGEQGLYAYMLRRNASNSKTYLAEAALYCQIACCGSRMSVLGYCLATNDTLRHGFLQFRNGWENLHQQLDCDRLMRAINGRTGGLLEVEARVGILADYDYDLFFRAARTRDPALTELLSWYRRHSVNFIHRTARSYILETISGQQLLASSHKSFSDIENIVFETWLVSHLILPCLESVAPVNAGILASGPKFLNSELLKTRSGELKGVVKFLARNGYLWLESYLTRPMSLASNFRSLESIPFVMTYPWQVSLTSVFGTYDYSCTFNELRRTDFTADPAYLLCILFGYVVGRNYIDPDGVDETHHDCYEVLLSHQPDPKYELINSFGERIRVFHHIMIAYSIIMSLQQVKIPALESWLQRAGSGTKTRECEPTMIECSSLFFRFMTGLPPGDPIPSQTFILGSFACKQYRRFLDHWLAECCEQQEAQVSTHIQILCLWPEGAWKPTMYALSAEDSKHVLGQLVTCGEFENVGILECLETTSQISSWVDTMRLRLPEIRSLIDVFRHFGKSETQIQSFAALEEPRIQQTYDEIIYRHWREWLYGTNDPYLEQHRGIQRPAELYFGVKT